VSGDGGGVAVTEMMIRGKTLRYRIFGVGVGDGWGDVIRGGCKKEWKGNTKRKLCKIGCWCCVLVFVLCVNELRVMSLRGGITERESTKLREREK